jgi:hypothetical protein
MENRQNKPNINVVSNLERLMSLEAKNTPKAFTFEWFHTFKGN